jgi:hypothetical protein
MGSSSLGLERVEAAQSFIDFREKLSTTTLGGDAPEVLNRPGFTGEFFI